MTNKVLKTIAAILAIAFICICVYKYNTAHERAFKEINSNSTSAFIKYDNFIDQYPKSVYVKDAYEELYNITLEEKSIHAIADYIIAFPESHLVSDAKAEITVQCSNLYKVAEAKNTIQSWTTYIKHVPKDYYEDAEERLSALCDIAYKTAKRTNTIKSWNKYKDQTPYTYHRDADDRIDKIKNRAWSTDYKAWKQAKAENTKFAFEKYLRLYPKGKYRTYANSKLIDFEVDDVFSSEHGSLPSMDKTSYGYGSSTKIEIENNTSYTLTLLYSGPTSKKLVISSQQSKTISFKNGDYRIAASVDAANVGNFAGSEELNGGSYSVTYYITTSRY